MIRFYSVRALLTCASLTIVAAAAAAQSQSPPPASTERPALGSMIASGPLANLPANGNLLSLLDSSQAEVISDRIDTGGLSTAEAALMGAHGSTWTQTRFRVGAVDVTDPAGGRPLLLPGVLAWERVTVATGLMPLDINAPGLEVTLEPRRPADRWTASIDGFTAPHALLARAMIRTPPAITRLDSFNHASLFVTGPLDPGRVGLFIESDATVSSKFERDNPTQLDASLASGFVHLEFTPSGEDQVRTLVWLQRGRAPFSNRNALGQPAAADVRTSGHVQLSWDRRLGSGLVWTSFGGFTARDRSPDVEAAAAIVIERLSDGPVPSLLSPRHGRDETWSIGTRADADMQGHHLRAGVELLGTHARTRAGFSGTVGELVDGVPARVWVFSETGRDSDWQQNTFSAYAADRVQVAPRVVFDAAIRFESSGGSATGSANDVRWNNWLPRASLRFNITPDGGFAGFIGYGRYGHELPLRYFAYGDEAAPFGNVYRWTAASGTHVPLPGEYGPLVARVGPGTNGDSRFSAIDPGLNRPYMDEIVLGLEGRPRPATVLRLSAIARREQQLVGLVDTGAPISSYSTVLVPDPGNDRFSHQILPVYNRLPGTFGADRYLLTNPADDRATFVGVELSAQTTIERLFLLAGATAGRSEGLSANRGFQAGENDQGVIGELFTDPNAMTNARGRLFTERGYTIKLAGTYGLPWDLNLGVIARYQDGQHFARLVIVPNLNQGAEAIRAFPNGKTRFTYSMTVDARLAKTFAGRVAVMIDGYNLFNQANEIEEFPVTGPTSRLTAAAQPPRAVHIGLRLTF